MSTSKSDPILSTALASIQKKFRKKLTTEYLRIKRNSSEGKYDTAGICAGKFCEIVIRLLQQEVFGSYTAFGKKIGNMADECRKLITSPTGSAVDSVRIIIPRAIIFMYTLRNKRGIGHVGGDVDANVIDAMTIGRTADWIMCELIRVYHGLSLEEAQEIVDSISTRELPIIWEVAGKKRVLRDGLNAKQKALLLLYSEPEAAVLSEDLCDWIEYVPSMFKKRVLNTLHKDRLIEHDTESDVVYLSPKGIKVVEDSLL